MSLTATAPLIPAGSELITGERLTADEFLARWDGLPDLKHAELIDGVVYVSSPVSRQHGEPHSMISGWLFTYAMRRPGCQSGHDITWRMLGSIPQPDAFLRRRAEFGGQSREGNRFYEGAPELAVEICETSTDYDFGPKRALYQRAGVREYITVETLRDRVTWRVLEAGRYVDLPVEPVMKSREFPGLWLDIEALFAGDAARMVATLEEGLSRHPLGE